MKVILKNISCIGFGAIPDVKIDFHNSKNTTAFLAHNGYGKTSIINAIKTALSGKKEYLAGRDKSGRDIHYDEEKVFKAWLESNNKDSYSGEFSCSIMIDDKEWTHIFKMDKANKEVSFATKRPDLGYSYEYDVDPGIKPYLESNFLELIFFDPTKTAKIFDPRSDFNAEECIKRFCDLNTIQKSVTEIESHVKDRIETIVKQSGETANKLALKRIDDNKQKLKELLEQRESELEDLYERRNDFLLEQENLVKELKKIQEKNEEYKKDYEKYQNEINLKNTEIKNKINSLYRNLTTNPFLLVKDLKNVMSDLVSHFQNHQIPEQDATLLVEHILSNNKCICGDELNEKKIEEINNFKKNIATSINVITFINNIKSSYETDVRNTVDQDPKLIIDDTRKLFKDMKLAEQKKDNLGTDEDIEKIKSLKEKQGALLNQLKNIDVDIFKYANKEITSIDMNTNTMNISAIKKQIETLDEQYGNAEGIDDYKKFKKSFILLLEKSLNKALDRLSLEIKNDCNERIQQDYEGKDLEIKEINKTIMFESKTGGSSGEEATISYLFILCLIEKTNIQFPIIIDNPTVFMDSVSKKVILELIPRSKSQKIFFMYDDERLNYADKFEIYNANQNNYILCARKIGSTYDNVINDFKARNLKGFESDESIVSYDRNFFLQAQFPEIKPEDKN